MTDRGAAIVVAGIVVGLIGGFALSVSDSKARYRTVQSWGLGTAAACRELSRTTRTSSPVSASGDEIDQRYDKVVKFYGRAAARVADKTGASQTRQLLIAYAAAARAKKWTSVAGWRSDPAQIALQSRCAPFRGRPAP
jgi:hypothetical protein